MAARCSRHSASRPRLPLANPWVVDAALMLLVQAAETIPFVVPRAPSLPPATWASYGLTTLGVLPLLWRRRAPVTVLAAVLAAQVLYRFTLDGPGQPLPYNALVALYTVAELTPARWRIPVGAGTLVLIFPSVALNSGEARELLFSLFLFGAAYGFGRLTHTRKAYTAALEDRATQLERANRIEAEQAAAAERARIAREMHDILSHAVSLMVVQAEAGPVAVRTAPERAEAAFEAISETGRDAMTQLRRMLGVLRQDTGAPEPASRRPLPALADLPLLVEQVASGGLAVEYVTVGSPRSLSPATEATVYRIVQESLTNVVRHASAESATVRVELGAETVEVTVTDNGRGAPVGSGGRPDRITGHGLIGLRERAAALGGTAETGPGPDGTGFRVRVRFPPADVFTEVDG
ncbi:sensor histidine kinase [Actinacidiphila glaucinigra]|uniref:sensor histidine kinase n=1 Tax=Actinacidiphila glaucinigra TaxID=235986 RepID=UPI00379852D6